MRAIAIILILTVVPVAGIRAQEAEPWTLQECIAYAVENNISLKRQELTTSLSEKDLLQSKLSLLPDLGAAVEHDLGSGRVLDRGTYEWVNTDVSQGDLGLGSNLTLFQGLAGFHRIRRAQAHLEMQRSEYEMEEDRITLQVMTAYLELLRKEELYEIAAEKVKVTRLQLERMEQLVEVGNASRGELLEVKAQHSTEKYNMTEAKNQLDVARLALRQWMNLPPGEPLQIEMTGMEDPELIAIPELDSVYQRAVREMPQIASARQSIDYHEKDLAVARGEMTPELFARGLYYSNYSDKLLNPREPDPTVRTMDYPLHQQIIDNQYKQVTIGVNIPIFNRWEGRTRVSKAKINLEDASYRLEDAKLNILKEIQQYHADAEGARDKYLAARESVANNEEAFRYMEEKFRVGMATALELEEARNKLFSSRSDLITSRYVFIFYTRILDFYSGNELLPVQ